MIEVSDLSFSFGGDQVLKHISFSVERSEFFCIAGRNGAGKSTLLRLLSRIYKPLTGLIKLNDRDIWSYERKEFSKVVAFVSQSPSYDFVKVEEFVSLGRLPHFGRFQLFESRVDREKVLEALTLCGIVDLKEKYLTELSGGERQLAFIARALAVEPELLLLDEPLMNLDINHQERIIRLLLKLRNGLGLTIVAVLHDLNIAGEFCDRLMLLKNGEVLSMGTPHSVINKRNLREAFLMEKPVIFKNPISSKPFFCICNINNNHP